MVGGMISSTILTLRVIPAIYALVKARQTSSEASLARPAALKLAE
jgi:Cu(I)/Ag(I) efflux system membrane protein CusA/SilA